MLSDIINNSAAAAALSTGIIGGADGPTAILVTSNPIDWLLIAILAAVIVILVALFAIKFKCRRKGKKYRRLNKYDKNFDNVSSNKKDS